MVRCKRFRTLFQFQEITFTSILHSKLTYKSTFQVTHNLCMRMLNQTIALNSFNLSIELFFLIFLKKIKRQLIV